MWGWDAAKGALRAATVSAGLVLLPAASLQPAMGLPPIPPPKPALPSEVAHIVSRTLKNDEQLIKQALKKYRRGDFKGAKALARKSGNPLAETLVQWLRLTREGVKVPFSQITAFLDERGNWPRQDDLQRTAEYSMPLGHPKDKIIAWFEEHAAVSAEGAMAHARALWQSGRREEATALIRSNWISLNFNRSQENQYRRRYRRLLRAEDHLARLDRLLWDHQRYAAFRQAKRMGPDYVKWVRARMKLRFSRPGIDRALDALPKRFRNDPGVVFERASWRMRRGRYNGVVELIDPPDWTVPRPDLWWPLREWASRRALERGQFERAYRLASQHGLSEGDDFAEAEWLAGWIAARFLNRQDSAYDHFARIYSGADLPRHKARGGFWAGEMASLLSRGELAERWYSNAALHSTSFYGQLAAERMGRPYFALMQEIPRAGPVERRAFDRQEAVRMIRLLTAIGEHRLQKTFLLRLLETSQSASDFILIAELAQEIGRPELAIYAATTAQEQGIVIPQHLYPNPLIAMPSQEQPEPALVLSVIRQESKFLESARSSAGARGLMQVLPLTAYNVARKLRIPYSRSQLTEDPEYNIRIGRAYLRQLLRQYDGSYVLALTAYNAGPSRVSNWIERNGDPRKGEISMYDWIEAIGFDETRNYVQRILETLPYYRYAQDDVQIADFGPETAPKFGGYFTSISFANMP